MLLHATDFALAPWIDSILPTLAPHLADHVDAETHGSAIELRTGVHDRVSRAIGELATLRSELSDELRTRGLRAASAGMHPTTVWQETRISGGERYQQLYASLRELARREPTFALHVHVAVPDPEDAVRAMNGLRGHLPLLLALSANSPFWQGRETGLASTRTPMFGAFPRVGLPRAFADYDSYLESIDVLIRCGAFPGADIPLVGRAPAAALGNRRGPHHGRPDHCRRLHPTGRAGAVAGAHGGQRGALRRGPLSRSPSCSPRTASWRHETAWTRSSWMPRSRARSQRMKSCRETLDACAQHAEELGCREELEGARELSRNPGAERQREQARETPGLTGLVAALADAF